MSDGDWLVCKTKRFAEATALAPMIFARTGMADWVPVIRGATETALARGHARGPLDRRASQAFSEGVNRPQ